MSELEELRLDAYENTKLYKERTKRCHDKRILNREFKEGELVLLFNSILKIFLGKLRSRWPGPFVLKSVKPNGAVEVWSETTRSFTVNGQRSKHYIIGDVVEKGLYLVLKESS